MFNPIKFTLEVFSGMPKVFQEDVPLLGIFIVLDFPGLIGCIQPLALVNFGIPFDSLKSFSFGILVYTEINTPISPDIGAH